MNKEYCIKLCQKFTTENNFETKQPRVEKISTGHHENHNRSQ